MKFLFALALCAALVQPLRSHAADKAALEAHALSYHSAGKAVVEMALTKKIDAAEVDKKVQIMLADATWYSAEYAKAFPAGAKLLKVITDHLDEIKKLTFKQIEHEWHDMHHFDSADKDIGLDVKAEENEHFTDPIHSIIHPLLVLKAAQDFASSKSEESLKSVKEEMEEGLEQMEKQKAALLKK